jgi:hypothetical protein
MLSSGGACGATHDRFVGETMVAAAIGISAHFFFPLDTVQLLSSSALASRFGDGDLPIAPRLVNRRMKPRRYACRFGDIGAVRRFILFASGSRRVSVPRPYFSSFSAVKRAVPV